MNFLYNTANSGRVSLLMQQYILQLLQYVVKVFNGELFIPLLQKYQQFICIFFSVSLGLSPSHIVKMNKD